MRFGLTWDFVLSCQVDKASGPFLCQQHCYSLIYNGLPSGGPHKPPSFIPCLAFHTRDTTTRIKMVLVFCAATHDINKHGWLQTGCFKVAKNNLPYFTGYKAIFLSLTSTPAPIIALRLFYVLKPMLPLLIIKT
jgi:hypothetical protein